MYPLLSLSQIEIDPELARRLPRRLAYYHLALPIARDDGNITVAMAYPDNQKVVGVLETVLGTVVTPVRSYGDEIRRTLDAIWENEDEAGQSGIICWSADKTRWSPLQDYAHGIATALSIGILDTIYDSPLEDFIELGQTTRPTLAACEALDIEIIARLMSRLPTSILLTRGSFIPPRNILHVLRGHTPDKHVLDWIIPIAQYYDSQITLLATATSVKAHQGNPLMSDFARLILPEHPAQMIEYGQILASMSLQGRLRVSDGALENIIISTLANTNCDLVAIATENNGEFVHHVLSKLTGNTSAFLVIKP